MNKLFKSFADLIYPPLCLHCSNAIGPSDRVFCSGCVTFMELIDAADRCSYCFSQYQAGNDGLCSHCAKHKPVLNRTASAFDHVGPAATLVKKIKYGNQPYLADGAGAYMVAQLLNLGWPMPDVIIPVPITFTHWFARGYNQSQLLALSISRLLNRPVVDILSRKSGDYSQAGLNQQQRLKLSGAAFYLKKEAALHDKIILLVDDVYTTGSTLRQSAETLYEVYPDSIYGLTLCHSI